MIKILILLIVTCVIAIAVLASLQVAHNNNAVNVWTARCNSDGGVVQTIRYGFSTNTLACTKNGKTIDHQN